MKRVDNLSVAMTEIGMWARVQFQCEGEVCDGIVARISETMLCLASNCGFLHGSNRFDSYNDTHCWDFVLSEFHSGWSIRESDCGGLSLDEIISPQGMDSSADIILLGIYKDDGTFVNIDGVERRTPQGFFNEHYTTDTKYSGMSGYHSHDHDEYNTPIEVSSIPSNTYKIGVELEVEFNSSTLKNKFTRENKSNWFMCERDGSLSDSTGVEIITIPMLPEHIKDMETWEPLIEYLSGKAISWDSSRCGLHVHIGRPILGSTPEQQSETTGKLLYLYHHFLNGTELNTRIFGRSRSYNEKDGKTKEGEAVATLGSQVFQLDGVKDKVKKGMIEKSSTDRYFDINLTNTHTIEFRKGRGSIKASRITMVITYCEAMCQYAKHAEWKDISLENFIDYMKKSIKKDSQLYRFFESGESCN